MNRLILSAVAALLAELFQDIRPDLQDASAFFLGSGSTLSPLFVAYYGPYA